ncbi:MAG TPA: hypothetical protein VGG33_19130 [Polyangia bacterium]
MTTFNMTVVKIFPLLAMTAAQGVAYAETTSSEPATLVSASPEAPTIRQPQSLPWQLRPMIAGNVVSVATAAAVFNDTQGNLDIAVPTVFAAIYQLTSHWTPTIKLGVVRNNAPGAALDGTTLANPVLGATYTRALGASRIAVFGATTIPIGTGGGDSPNLRAAETNAAATAARPADSAMFAVDYLAGIVGVDVAYLGCDFTAQAEMTLLHFVRARGGDSGGATDAFRTQATLGVHVSYFFGTHFSLSSDLHHRRWLSSPTTANATPGPHITFAGAGLNTTSAAVGPRFHFQLGQRGWVRPGLSFVRGFDARGFGAPLITAQATAVQLDIPVTF